MEQSHNAVNFLALFAQVLFLLNSNALFTYGFVLGTLLTWNTLEGLWIAKLYHLLSPEGLCLGKYSCKQYMDATYES